MEANETKSETAPEASSPVAVTSSPEVWERPTWIEIRMDAEIGSYQGDDLDF